MFHIVPHVLWQRKVTPDKSHRVFVGLNCLLLRGEGHTILFDAGVGNKLSDKQKKIYGLDSSATLMRAFGEAGIEPADIDIVVPSHLHFDHAGWLTMREKDNELVPVFPNARHIIQKAEWTAAHESNELTAGSYMPDDFDPLDDRGLLSLIDGDIEIAPSVRLELTGGHSPGHQTLTVESGDVTLLCPGEIIPTTWHLRVPWLTCFDLEPVTVLKVKKRLMVAAAEAGWILFLSHDPSNIFGRIKPVSDKEYAWQPLQ